MPAQQRSLDVTNAYRRRLLSLGESVETTARQAWPRIEDFDTTPWAEFMAGEVARAQTSAVRLTAGYLGAFLRSETGRGTVPAIDSRRYAGLSRDGRPIRELLQSPLIAVRAGLKEGLSPAAALARGLHRARRSVKFEAVQAGRDALTNTLENDERFSGWQRNVAGTCAACMAFSGQGGPHFDVHPGCQCVPMPTVSGVRDRFPLPTGAALFAALSTQEQEAAIGAEAAALVREGAELKDFVSHSQQATQDDFLTQKPVEEVVT